MAPVLPIDEEDMRKLIDAVERRMGPGRRHRDEKRSPVWVDRLITWGVGIFLAWGALQVDVAVLKQRTDALEAMTKEIRDDVKTLLRRP
jgi:hypothetical protein